MGRGARVRFLRFRKSVGIWQDLCRPYNTGRQLESVMPTPDEHQALSRRRDELRQELAHVAEPRQGAVVALDRRCGKPQTATARRKETLDIRPYWSVTRAVHGKTQFRSIAPHAVRRRGADRGVPSLSTPDREFVDVSTRLCDAQLEAGGSGAPEKKGGFETTLTAEVSAEAERLIGEGAVDDFQAIEIRSAAGGQLDGAGRRAQAQRRPLRRAGPPSALRVRRRGALRRAP